MTAKKDFKRRVRDRQAKTGESYVTARRHVLSQAPESAEAPADAPHDVPPEPGGRPIVVEEMLDLTAAASALGFQCRVYASSKLSGMVEHAALLQRVRDIVNATTEDPDMAPMRAVILRGERPALPPRGADWWPETRKFIARAVSGIGGISEGGNMVAFAFDATMILADIGFRQTPVMTDLPPRLVLTAIAQEPFSVQRLFLR